MENRSLRYRQMIWPFLKLTGISGLVFVSFLVIFFSILSWKYQDRISQLFLQEVNRNLKTEIFSDKLSFNLLRSFPMASLSFEGVRINEVVSTENPGILLQAEAIRFQFNFMDILRKNYHVRQVVISNGILRPEIREGGEPNYIFWNVDDSHGADNIHFDIQRIQLNNMALHFTHVDQSIELQTDIKSLQLAILYGGNKLDLTARGNMDFNHLQINELKFPENRPLSLDLAMQADESGHILLHPGKISWNHQEFKVAGDFIPYDGHLYIETIVSAENIQTASFRSDLPVSIQDYLAPWQFGGKLNFKAGIQGWIRPGYTPHIHADFAVKSGSLKFPETTTEFLALDFNGSYTNGMQRNARTTRLNLENISGKTHGGQFRGSAMADDFIQPDIHINLFADLPAGEFSQIIGADIISEASGRVNLEARFKGKTSSWAKLTSRDLLGAELSGKFSLQDGTLSIKESNTPDYENLKGTIIFNNNRFVVEDFSGHVGESHFSISGQMANMLPYLFIPDEYIHIQANLKSSRFVIDELLQHTTQGTDTVYKLHFPKRLQLQLNAHVDNLSFRRFELTGLKGEISMRNQRLFADNLFFHTMDGQVQMHGIVDASHDNKRTLNCEAILHGVDINQLFYQMGNFGQTNITDQHIYGDVSAEVIFSSSWSTSLDIDWGSVETLARLKVENGRLVNFHPFVEMGRFLRIDGMSDISFFALENEILIANSMINIPDMSVGSSAISLQLSGQHSFDNEIDYRIQVLLSDLMARNHRERRNPQERYGDIIDDGLGRTTLFLRLTGTGNDPVFRYDYQGVRDKIRQDLRQERETLINVFRREFNFLRRQDGDTIMTDREKEMQRIRQQERGRFIFDWEDHDQD